jgi:hypothetical protein
MPACRGGGGRKGSGFFDGGKGMVRRVCDPSGTGIGSGGGFVVKEKIIESELYGRTRDTELVVISGGVEPFAVIHAGRQSGSGVKQCRGAKIVTEEVGEMKRLSLVRTRSKGGGGGGGGGEDR